MSTVLMGLILFSLSGALALLWQRRIELFFGLSILVSIILTYIAGLLNVLQAGFYAVLALAALAACFCVWRMVRYGWRKQLVYIATPGGLAFLLLLACVLLGYRNRLCDSFDEFSHWIVEIKNMYLLEGLPNINPQSTVYFREYPPATALFSYIWIKLSGAYNEGDAFRANTVLMLAMLLPLFRTLEWKHWKGILPLSVLCFLLPLAFNGESYCSILADALLGSTAFYTVAFYYSSVKEKKNILMVSVPLFVMPLMKPSGIGVALITLLILAADMLRVQKSIPIGRRWASLAILLVCCALGQLSWKAYLASGEMGLNAISLRVDRMADIARVGLLPYQTECLKAFGGKMISPVLWGSTYYAKLPYAVCIILFAILARLSVKQEADLDSAAQKRVLFQSVLIGGVLYALAVLVTYLLQFSSSEAAMCASAERYLSTILIMMFGVLALVLIEGLTVVRPAIHANASACLLAALCIFLSIDYERIWGNTVCYNNYIDGAAIHRMQMEPTYTVLDALNGETDKVYLLMQEENNYTYLVNSYAFMQIRIKSAGAEEYYYIRSAKRQPGAGAANNAKYVTPEEWAAILRSNGYTHLYIYRKDTEFQRDFGCLFENPEDIQDKSLFRIENTDDGAVLHFVTI